LSWEDSVYLKEGEKIVCNWFGNCETSHTVIVQRGRYIKRHRPQEVKERRRGVLVLTTERIMWLEERGVFGKSYHGIFEMALENLRGISMGGALIKYVSITDIEGEQVFHLDGIGARELDNFKKFVFDQAETRKRVLADEKKKERVHVLLDFSFLKSYMEKGGLMMQTYKCPECGAPTKLPESGNEVKCGHCGNTIYAQDIFEKVKGLVG
jgi:predicted Zn finger-like uncharacterized protein